jgi:hypothetical protein
VVSDRTSDALDRADAWAPPLDFGFWRTRYAECCDAVLAYDRIIATMPPGALRGRLEELRPALRDLLRRAWSLAELGSLLLPAGPRRDPRFLDLYAGERMEHMRRSVTGPPPDPGLRKALLAACEDMWRITDDVARLTVRLHEQRVHDHADAIELTGYLRGLADGVAAAHRSGWTGES